MRTATLVGLIILFAVATSPAQAQTLCEVVHGATVVAQDGEFLGIIGSEAETDSILNEYGTFGSEYSSDSIWNEYDTYGGEYSSLSPFNRYTSTPPVLVKDGKAIAYLTVNRALEPAVNPYVLKSCDY